METPRKMPDNIMVNWNSVFSNPRRVRMVEEAEPKSPPPPSLTWAKMTRIMVRDINICATFRYVGTSSPL
jgi:hypothetical protein